MKNSVWIIHYLNRYQMQYGVFPTEQDAINFFKLSTRAELYKAVELPIQAPGANVFDYIEPKNLPKQNAR